jgi:large subunit ribosomal protein L19
MSAPSPIIQKLEATYHRGESLPVFRAGDTVKVWVKIREGEKTRLQAFEGVCIRRSHGVGARSTFTVRKISYGVGVERVFPVHSPNIEKVEVRAQGRVRKSRLYYLRDRSGKAARIKERAFDKSKKGPAAVEAAPAPEPAAEG